MTCKTAIREVVKVDATMVKADRKGRRERLAGSKPENPRSMLRDYNERRMDYLE